MSIDPLNSELQKLQYLKTFRLELDGLVQSYRDNQSLIAVLRNALEESPSSSASSLQGRVSVIDRMSQESRSLGAVHSDVKTMLLSRIEALESSAPKKALQNVRVAEDSLLKDFPNEIVSRAFELIPQEERTLRVRKTLIELFEKSNNQEACSAAVQSLEPTLRARILTNALSFYQKKRDFEPLKYFLSFIRTGTDPVPEELIKIVGFLPIESFRGALSNLLEISDRNDRAEILITVTSTPEKRRVEVIENLHFLFSRQKSQETPNRILTVFNHVPVDLLPDIIEKTASLIRETLDGGKCYRILLALGNIPAEQRADVIEKATPLIRETPNEKKCGVILLALGNIPADQRADVIEKATPLIREISDEVKCYRILLALGNIPAEQRADVIEKATPLIRESQDGEKCYRILEALGNIPADQRADVIEKATPLIRETQDGFKCGAILVKLGRIPAEQRADVLEKATPLIRETQDGLKCAIILITIGNIPADQRADVLEKATPLIRETPDGKKCGAILGNLNKIPADQRADVIEKAIPLIRETSDGVKCAFILITLGRIPANQRADVIEKATPLIRETSDPIKCSHILDALANIPENLRSLAFETISPLIQDSEDGYRKAILIGLFSLLPVDQRTPFISELHTFKTGSLMQMNLKKLSSLTLLPPEHRLSILQLLNRSPDLLRKNILHNLFISDPALKQACLAYLVQEIETVISSPAHARLLSKAVVASEESLGLHEEHPLFQKAIEILCLTDPQTQNDNKNPYRMYGNLVDFAQTEPLINIPLPTQEVSGIQVGIDLDGFRASSLQGRFTREDLPDGIRPDAFNTLFSNLEIRLTSTAGLSEEIERSYEYSLQKLKENIVHGAVISGLLQLPTNPNEPIREASFYLYTILQAILRTSPERKINELLSDQERALLSFAHATIACRTGQLDGIALYYNALPLELRIKTGTALTPSQERLRNVIDTFIQSTLNDTFAGREFLQLVGGQEALSQESHQTFYLKNRLFKHVGLRHSVTFDLNTGVLSNALLQASSIHLLESFFGCCAPETLTKTFQKEIESSLRNPASGLLKPLDDFFDLQVSEGRGNKETWIFYNEESDGIELTELGALSLLEHFGKVRRDHVS